MGGSQPAGDTTTTSVSEPNSQLAPYTAQAYAAAQSLYGNGNQGPQYYPGQTVAPLNPTQDAALNAATTYGENISPLYGTATAGLGNISAPSYSTSTPGEAALTGITQGEGAVGSNYAGVNALDPYASGSMLGPGPYLGPQMAATNQLITDAYQRSVAPQTAGSAEMANRFGSGSYQNQVALNNQQLGQNLSAADLNLLGQNYQNQSQLAVQAAQAQQSGIAAQQGIQQQNIANQIQAGSAAGADYTNAGRNSILAAATAPQIAQMPVSNIQALSSAGQQQQQQQQAMDNAAIQQYNYGQLAPYQNLSTYLNFLSGNPASSGGMNSTTAPYFMPSTGSQVAAGASSAASLGLLAYLAYMAPAAAA